MDFSWVKELADKANERERERQAQERREKEEQRQLALATSPFVEKLHLLISTCGDEFNKYMKYESLKVLTSRIQKRVKSTQNPEDPELSYPEESAAFTFTRKDWTFGIRGSKGIVEFLELPSSGNEGSFGFRLDEVGATPSSKLIASLEEKTQRIVWKSDGQIVDGPAIVTLCKDYFKQFIERTNPQ